ncbi:MAG: SUN domain-containing protein [Bernardetiaceae bacterium]|jgi:hypothetical protein|nr:SUN domain-containing protein [Bernardetiaceae bacterium]
MMKYVFWSLLGVSSPGLGQPGRVNATSFSQGASVVSATSSFGRTTKKSAQIAEWSTEGLLDGNPKVGWSSEMKRTNSNQFIIELSEDYLIDQFRFNNLCQKEYAGICAKQVMVEASTQGPTTGFVKLGEFTLGEYAPVNDFSIQPAKARWLRLSILSNYGHDKYTELMEFEAWGRFAVPEVASLPYLNGVWSSNWGWVSLNTNPLGFLYGCYEYNQGTLSAEATHRRVIEFAWDEGAERGWATLVLNKEGTRLAGIWGVGNDRSRYGFWDFTRQNNRPNACGNDQKMAQRPPTRYRSPFKAGH